MQHWLQTLVHHLSLHGLFVISWAHVDIRHHALGGSKNDCLSNDCHWKAPDATLVWLSCVPSRLYQERVSLHVIELQVECKPIRQAYLPHTWIANVAIRGGCEMMDGGKEHRSIDEACAGWKVSSWRQRQAKQVN